MGRVKQKLCLMNNIVAMEVFKGKEAYPALEEIIYIVTGERFHITMSRSENDEKSLRRSVRFDIVAKDEDDNWIDIEFQMAGGKEELAHRAGFYSSLLDAQSLEKGERFSKKRRSIVIFLCQNDPLKSHRPVSHFVMRETSTNENLGDGREIYFFSVRAAKEKGNAAQKNLANDLIGEYPVEITLDVIKERLLLVYGSLEVGQMKYSEILEARLEKKVEKRVEARYRSEIEARVEAQVEARVEAQVEARVEAQVEARESATRIQNAVAFAKQGVPLDTIATALSLTEDELKKVRSALKKEEAKQTKGQA